MLELAAEGLGNAEIAARLFTSVSTVRKHLEHIFDRTGVRTRGAAVARMLPELRDIHRVDSAGDLGGISARRPRGSSHLVRRSSRPGVTGRRQLGGGGSVHRHGGSARVYRTAPETTPVTPASVIK